MTDRMWWNPSGRFPKTRRDMFSLAGARKETAEDAFTLCPFQTLFLFKTYPSRPLLSRHPRTGTSYPAFRKEKAVSVRIHQDGIPFAEFPLEDVGCEGGLEVLLDRPAKRSCPVSGVIPDLPKPLPAGVGDGAR